jgi:hypothetical protein
MNENYQPLTILSLRIVFIHAFVGWILCGATMGAGMALTSITNALYIHAIGAPLFFIAISFNYFKKFNQVSPLKTAVLFVGFVIVVDFFIVALLINRSLEMFSSILGTWIPFLLIFGATYATGKIVIHKRSYVM